MKSHEIGNMDRETLDKGLILRDKIDDCKGLHQALCYADTVNMSVFSADDNIWHTYPVPKELIPEILSDIESCLSDLQKSFREL